MPVPRGSLFGVPDENFPKNDGDKHIRWDDENLRRNEMTKTARDIIDEPDTPWASPPPELFDSEEEEDDDESHEHEMGRKVLEAARCCLAMLSDLSGFSPVKGVALKLHIGVGAGRMVAYTVGGHLKKWSVHACVLREHTLVAPNA